MWVGYDRPRSLGKDETGSRVAVPIWTAFMREALAGTAVEDFPMPERVVLVPVDLGTAGGCARPVTMAFIAGTEPKEACGPAALRARRLPAACRAAARASRRRVDPAPPRSAHASGARPAGPGAWPAPSNGDPGNSCGT